MTNLHSGTGAPVPGAEALLTTGDLAGERIQTYQLLFDANPQPMWVFDRNTLGMLAVNEAAVAHYGYSREEFLSLSLLDIRRTLGGARVDAEQIERESADASGHLLPTAGPDGGTHSSTQPPQHNQSSGWAPPLQPMDRVKYILKTTARGLTQCLLTSCSSLSDGCTLPLTSWAKEWVWQTYAGSWTATVAPFEPRVQLAEGLRSP